MSSNDFKPNFNARILSLCKFIGIEDDQNKWKTTDSLFVRTLSLESRVISTWDDITELFHRLWPLREVLKQQFRIFVTQRTHKRQMLFIRFESTAISNVQSRVVSLGLIVHATERTVQTRETKVALLNYHLFRCEVLQCLFSTEVIAKPLNVPSRSRHSNSIWPKALGYRFNRFFSWTYNAL